MATFNKFQPFVEYLAEGVFNLQTNVLKVMLTNSAPAAASGVKLDLTEITAGNGYSAGGMTVTTSSSLQTAGTYKLTCADVVLSASGAVGPFRYAVLYSDTPTSPADPLIGYWDYGSALTLANGETFTVDFDAANGVLTLA